MREDFTGRVFTVISIIMIVGSLSFICIAIAMVFPHPCSWIRSMLNPTKEEEQTTITLDDIDMDTIIMEKVEDTSQFDGDTIPVYIQANGIVHSPDGDVESLVSGYLYPDGTIDLVDYTPLSVLAEEQRKNPTPPSDPE
jgi:hypothetical protein